MQYIIFVLFLAIASSCSDDPVGKAKSLIVDTALDDYLADVQDEAVAAGGAATAVVAGVEALLEVSDTDSPLFGTRIVIPADGLPAGITAAVLSIVPAAVTAPEDFGLVGSGVDIQLRDVQEGHSDVTLAVAATLTLPYDAGDLDDLHAVPAGVAISHFTDGAWRVLDDSDRSEDRVTGETISFSPFVAMAAYVPTELERSSNTYSFAVAQTGNTICSGSLDLSDAAIETELTYMYHVSGLYHASVRVQERVNDVLEHRYDTFSEYESSLLELPTASVDADAAAEWSDLNVYCGGTRVFNWDGVGITTIDIQFSGWETTQTTEGLCGVMQEACTIHKGKVRVQAELVYLDSNDSSLGATASLDAVIDNTTWDVMP